MCTYTEEYTNLLEHSVQGTHIVFIQKAVYMLPAEIQAFGVIRKNMFFILLGSFMNASLYPNPLSCELGRLMIRANIFKCQTLNKLQVAGC